MTEEQTTDNVEASKAADKEAEILETTAREFMTLAPEVKSRVAAMASKSGKGLGRAVSAFLEFPFATEYPKFKNQDETTLFMMMLQLAELKARVSKAFEKDLAEVKAEVVNRTVNEVMEKHVYQQKENVNV